MIKNVALDFPLCADSRRDEAIRPVFERAVNFLLERIGKEHLEAVILAGSLARGEGSVLLKPDGFRLLGDVEFLVILRPPFDWPEVRRQMVALSRQATREFGKNGCIASIEYQPAGMVYLRRNIRPCIFAYDLFHHGKVVWGRVDIMSEIRAFNVGDIPRNDAVELILNRMMELLVQGNPGKEGPDRVAHNYQLVKTTLDLAGSALAFTGQYVSPYSQRGQPFETLIQSNLELRTALPNPGKFKNDLELAIRCKLAPTEYCLERKDLTQRISSTLAWAKGIWVWEMRKLLDLPSGNFWSLLDGYIRHESIRERLKGWLKYYRHPLRPRGTLDPVRTGRLALRASPRTLIYAAALLSYEGMQDGSDDWKQRVTSLLPLPVQAQNGDVLSHIGEVWHWLIRNN